MKHMWNNRIASLLLLVLTTVGISCTKNELTDGDKFMLFYPDITDIGPSTNMNLDPTYHGPKPSDFKVYQVKFEGSPIQTTSFQIEAETGRLKVMDTDELAVGVYSISILCVSSGKLYEFPDLIKVNMMKPVPDGISVEPNQIELLMTQVNNVDSAEQLPTAQVITEGNHISIKSYRIANVWRDSKKVEDWSGFFSINEATGLISVLKSQNFVAGTYVFDLKLLTKVVSMESEEGFFPGALTIDVVSPPVELAYDPQVKRVEEGTGYVSLAPTCVASAKELVFSLKAVYPEDAPLTIDPATGVLTLAENNTFKSGDKIQVSVRVTNAYGTKDFDQVTRIDIVDYIKPITTLSYNDSTVWHGTAYTLKPVEVDGDDVKFSFAELPEELSELVIDELTGAISVEKGNKLPKGEYSIKVKVSNDKGEMTDAIAFNIVDNPYFFTKVSWGNNLGLTPVSDYASQHRVSLDQDTVIPALKEYSDITEEGWKNVKFEMIDGSLRLNSDAKIDPATGSFTVLPSYIRGKAISFKRTHMALIQITVGEGTSGETVRKVPVFFDFNAPRVDSGNANAPVYTVEFNPFVFQCNPKKGGYFVKPLIKDQDGNKVSSDVYSDISMTFLGNSSGVHPYYWNLGGPDTHLDGNMSVTNGFLYQMWTNYYKAAGKAAAYTNVNPIYSYHTDQKYLSVRIAYIMNGQLGYSEDEHLKLYVVPEKWVDNDGIYADGIFMAQVRMGYKDLTGAVITADKGKSPYQMYPFFIWFDTEF